MNAQTPIIALHGPKIGLLSAQSNADLWVMLGHCDGTVARLEDQLNEQATASPRYTALSTELDIWRSELARIEAELRERVASFLPGVDLRTLAERIG